MRGTHAERLQCMQLQQGKTTVYTVGLQLLQMRQGVCVYVCVVVSVHLMYLPVKSFLQKPSWSVYFPYKRKSTAVMISLLNHGARSAH